MLIYVDALKGSLIVEKSDQTKQTDALCHRWTSNITDFHSLFYTCVFRNNCELQFTFGNGEYN